MERAGLDLVDQLMCAAPGHGDCGIEIQHRGLCMTAFTKRRYRPSVTRDPHDQRLGSFSFDNYSLGVAGHICYKGQTKWTESG